MRGSTVPAVWCDAWTQPERFDDVASTKAPHSPRHNAHGTGVAAHSPARSAVYARHPPPLASPSIVPLPGTAANCTSVRPLNSTASARPASAPSRFDSPAPAPAAPAAAPASRSEAMHRASGSRRGRRLGGGHSNGGSHIGTRRSVARSASLVPALRLPKDTAAAVVPPMLLTRGCIPSQGPADSVRMKISPQGEVARSGCEGNASSDRHNFGSRSNAPACQTSSPSTVPPDSQVPLTFSATSESTVAAVPHHNSTPLSSPSVSSTPLLSATEVHATTEATAEAVFPPPQQSLPASPDSTTGALARAIGPAAAVQAAGGLPATTSGTNSVPPLLMPYYEAAEKDHLGAPCPMAPLVALITARGATPSTARDAYQVCIAFSSLWLSQSAPSRSRIRYSLLSGQHIPDARAGTARTVLGRQEGRITYLMRERTTGAFVAVKQIGISAKEGLQAWGSFYAQHWAPLRRRGHGSPRGTRRGDCAHGSTRPL